jgi:hypothetical protein
VLVKKSADDEWLSERVARRIDIPEHHLRELISKASDVVRQRLTADSRQLSGLPAIEIERLFMGAWSSPVAVILKAIGFRLATVYAIYRSRLSDGDAIRDDLFQTKAEYIAVRRPTAERIMRFYCARKAAKFYDLS